MAAHEFGVHNEAQVERDHPRDVELTLVAEMLFLIIKQNE